MTERFEHFQNSDALSGGSDELSEMLRIARADGPDTEQLARIASGLPLTEPPSIDASPSAETGGATNHFAATTLLKIGLITAVIGVSTLGVKTMVDDRSSAVATTDQSSERQSKPRRSSDPTGEKMEKVPSGPYNPKPTLSSSEGSDEIDSESSVAEEVRPIVLATGKRKRSVEPHDPGPAAELRLIKQAQRLLVEAPSRALALTEQHSRLFRPGRFEQERETIAIEALLRTGRRARAERRGSQFLDRFPESAYCRRIQVLMGQIKKIRVEPH